MNKIEILKMTDDQLDKVVHIRDTKYDRKRKYNDKLVAAMKRRFKKGKSFAEIASEFGVSTHGVRYRLDPEFRAAFNATRDGKHYGKTHYDTKNRVAYKRQLVADGLVMA